MMNMENRTSRLLANRTRDHATRVDWRDNALFCDLSKTQLTALESIALRVCFERGEPIIREGDLSCEFYLLEEGEVEVSRADGEVSLATLGPGSSCGLMAAVEHAPRSADVRASTRVVAVRLVADDIRASQLETLRSAFPSILANHLSEQSDHLRRTSDMAVAALRTELAEVRARMAMGSFVTYLVALIAVYTFAQSWSEQVLAQSTFRTPVTFAYLAVFTALVIAMMRRSGYPLEIYGLTWKNGGRALRDAVAWTSGFLALTVVGKWVLLRTQPAFADQPLLAFPLFQLTSAPKVLLDLLSYLLLAPLQELLARGGLQGSLQHFLTGPRVRLRAVLVASVVFSITHLHIGPAFALVVLLPSLLWGGLFARHGTLVGPAVSHTMVGLWVLYVMGIPGLR